MIINTEKKIILNLLSYEIFAILIFKNIKYLYLSYKQII